MTESILNVGTHLIDDGYDEFIMITADPHVLSTRLERTTGFLHALETKGKTCKTHVVADDVTSDALRDLLYNELRFGVRTLIFVANCFLLPRVYLALKDYRNLMPDTIGLIGFDNTEWTNFSLVQLSQQSYSLPMMKDIKLHKHCMMKSVLEPQK